MFQPNRLSSCQLANEKKIPFTDMLTLSATLKRHTLMLLTIFMFKVFYRQFV